MDIVINACFGGFNLSEDAYDRYRELGGTGESAWDISRNDPLLIQVVREMGMAADGPHSELNIVSIPNDVDWTIEEYDGSE